VRYSSEALRSLFGQQFVLADQAMNEHATPRGTAQEFIYSCWLKKGEC